MSDGQTGKSPRPPASRADEIRRYETPRNKKHQGGVFSIGYNAGVGVLGGATPMLAVYTIKRTHDDLSPAILLMAAAVVSIAVILGLRESYRAALPGSVERAAPRAASGAD